MTIELINTYSSRNLGDAAIMKSLAQLANAHVYTSLQETESLSVPGVHICQEKEDFTKINPEALISVGGDIFNNARPKLITRNFLAMVGELSKSPQKTIVFGQTIPASVKNLAEWYLMSAMKKLSAVVVRDKKSFDLLSRYNVNTRLSYDAAFALEPSQTGRDKAYDLYESHGLEPENTVLLSVRNFDQMYPHDQDEFELKLAETGRRLYEKGLQVAVLIQSDASYLDSDLKVAENMQQHFPELKILNVIEAARRDSDPVGTLIGVLELAHIVVAVRYHAAILRLVSGKVPFHISYSRKGDDLNKRLNLPGCNLANCNFEKMTDLIQASAYQKFDDQKIRSHVRDSFAWAKSQVSAEKKDLQYA